MVSSWKSRLFPTRRGDGGVSASVELSESEACVPAYNNLTSLSIVPYIPNMRKFIISSGKVVVLTCNVGAAYRE